MIPTEFKKEKNPNQDLKYSIVLSILSLVFIILAPFAYWKAVKAYRALGATKLIVFAYILSSLMLFYFIFFISGLIYYYNTIK